MITLQQQIEFVESLIVVAKVCQPGNVEKLAKLEAIRDTLQVVDHCKDIHFRLRPSQPLT